MPEGALYLSIFGSALRSENPRDIDVILVYDREKLDPRDAVALRRHVRAVVEPHIGRRLDVTLLTTDEAVSSRFELTVGSRLVWSNGLMPVFP